MEGAQAAEAAQVFLKPASVKLRLILADTSKARRLMFMSLLIIPLGYPLQWMLGVASSVAFGCSFLCCVGVFFLFKKCWPAKFILEEGYLTSSDDALAFRIGEQEILLPLNATTTVELTYQGFEGERLTTRIRASGVDTFIQLNGGKTYRFEMPSEGQQELLRNELRRWYHLKVRVKEHRSDGLTFLLHRDLSYEQIQSYKQEFGVSLHS